MNEGQRRKAANEAVFREVNERIEGLQRTFALTQREPLQIVCECDRLDCMERLTVGVEAYERVRATPDRFFVRPGHEDPEVESVVETGRDFLVVRKHAGEPRRIAVANDPRA